MTAADDETGRRVTAALNELRAAMESLRHARDAVRREYQSGTSLDQLDAEG